MRASSKDGTKFRPLVENPRSVLWHKTRVLVNTGQSGAISFILFSAVLTFLSFWLKFYMRYKIFISHSVSPKELAIVYALADQSAKKDIEPFLSDRDWNPEEPLPGRITQSIQTSDAILAVASNSGNQLRHLNRELVLANSLRKPIIFLVGKGLKVPARFSRFVVRINRNNLMGSIKNAVAILDSIHTKKDLKLSLSWLAIGGVLLTIYLLGKEK